MARVDAGALKNLQKALLASDDAYAAGIIKSINQRLDATLNFSKFWAQDKNFRLNVSPQERDLIFTIHDRTGTEYAFNERSSGLRYFLSYYIQYLAHDPDPAGRHQILVMDEPDAYLSSQGQQDLLKIFEAFAHPQGGVRRPVQVIYVTHSPFLIDKNYADRIRVVEKGARDEGTRVVRDVSRNHYEPLRSAFGAFVAETTFIGNCNLMVEGTSDQIFLAEAARHLRSKPGVPELDTLDLNQITIVPSGGASQVPYLVYLARGRDVERPAVIVLLDGDDAGNDAKNAIVQGVGLRGKRKPLLDTRYILQIGDLVADKPALKRAVMTEDLVPIELAVAATRHYLEEFCGCDPTLIEQISPEAVMKDNCNSPSGALEAINTFLESQVGGHSVQKIGFARAVMDTLKRKPDTEGIPEFESNMRSLLGKLNKMQRRAVRERDSVQLSTRLERRKKTFLQDHPNAATRQEAVVFVEAVEDLLDDSLEGDEIDKELLNIRRVFKLGEDLTEPISNYASFKEHLMRMQYAGRSATQETSAISSSVGTTDETPQAADPSTSPPN